jgi:hypothetical protein
VIALPPSRSDRRGQALVEMAIILPVLLLLVLMALDFGRVFFGWVGLTNASRIGASYAAAHPTAWGTPGNATQRAHYEDQIRADANALNCVLPETIPAPVFASGTDLRDEAQVTLTCEFSMITPLVSQIVGGTIAIRAESIFPIRSGFIGGIPVSSTLPSPSGSPSSSVDPSVTPAPTPKECKAPGFTDDSVGVRGNPNPALQTKWEQAGFTTRLLITRPPNQNYTVGSQSPLVGGQWGPCDTTIESVGP